MKKFIALSLLLILPLLAACATPDDDQDMTTPPQTEQAPPPEVTETIPLISDPQTHIWKPGYWALGGTGFYWVSGEVIARPDPTAVWGAARWVHHTYGWSFEKGHWE